MILTACRLFLADDRRRALAIYTVAGLCWYGLLVVTGYLGGRLVFEYGAAVVGGRADVVLTLHDLNVLATRQTDDNLRYSELVHHVSGWLTLALSGASGRSTVRSLNIDDLNQRPRVLFAGLGTFTDLAWSPDTRWLLVAWKQANQWLFIRSNRVSKVDAVANITREFAPGGRGAAPFPGVSSWCCQR